MNRFEMILRNTGIVIIFSVFEIILGIYEVRVFIDEYGSEINAVISTGNQLLMYLKLLEGGIWAAYLYEFYKVKVQHDTKQFSALYNGFRRRMTSVVTKMLLADTIISIVYPFLIRDNSVNTGITMAIFILLSFKFILPYYISAIPKNMIILKERKDIVEIINGFQMILILLIEIIIMKFFNVSIIFLLAIIVIINLFVNLLFKYIFIRMYRNEINLDELPIEISKKKSKDVLIHNISGIVFNNTDTILLSMTMTSLTPTFIYSSYNKIISQVDNLFSRIVDGLRATMGLKINTSSNSDNKDVFSQLTSGVIYTSTCITAGFIILINKFIEIWIGEIYVLPMYDVILMGIILYTNLIFRWINIIRDGYGLFTESKNFTIVMVVLNVAISLVLIKPLGITGVLIGTAVTNVFIKIPMNYKLVLTKIYPGVSGKWIEILASFALIIFCLVSYYNIKSFYIKVPTTYNFLSFIIEVFLVGFYCIFLISISYYFDKDFRNLITRIKNKMGIIKR